MTIAQACRRKTRRHPATGTVEAFVEITYPDSVARNLRLPLVDISISGLSFVLTEELPAIENGTNITDIVVRLGDCEIRGELVVMHLTPQTETRTICGALFYAASDQDLLKYRSAVAGMGVALPA
jgi:c-di-GMP-binding flagellar brake protein YcgR